MEVSLEKGPKREVLLRKGLKILNIKRAWSGPDSPPQSLDIENTALENVRLGRVWSYVTSSRTFLVGTLLVAAMVK